MVAAMLFAIQTATASASMTIKWNTHASAPAPRRTSTDKNAVQYATLIAVNGRTASVRLADGSVRTFIAKDDEVDALRALIGTRIAFRVTP